jgi:hypothetical protein
MRGPKPLEGNPYCSQCGDDLVFFVACSFCEDRIDIIGPNGNDGLHYANVMSAPPAIDNTASGFLRRADQIMTERGKTYDQPGGERSMGKTVQAFNAITGLNLTEAHGWLLMECLKNVRQWQRPAFHQDSADDGVAYSALKAEALSRA